MSEEILGRGGEAGVTDRQSLTLICTFWIFFPTTLWSNTAAEIIILHTTSLFSSPQNLQSLCAQHPPPAPPHASVRPPTVGLPRGYPRALLLFSTPLSSLWPPWPVWTALSSSVTASRATWACLATPASQWSMALWSLWVFPKETKECRFVGKKTKNKKQGNSSQSWNLSQRAGWPPHIVRRGQPESVQTALRVLNLKPHLCKSRLKIICVPFTTFRYLFIDSYKGKWCFYFEIAVNSIVSTKQTSLWFRTHPVQHELFHLSLFIRECANCALTMTKTLTQGSVWMTTLLSVYAEVDWIPQISQSTSPGIGFNIDMDHVSLPSLILVLSFWSSRGSFEWGFTVFLLSLDFQR